MPPQNDFPIGKLPIELFLDIADHLDPYSLIQLFLCCKRANQVLQPTVLKRARQHALPSAEDYDRRFTRDDYGTILEINDWSSIDLPRENLVQAIRTGRLNVITNYLDAGVDPNAFCLFGARMLNIAIRSRKTDVMNLLLSYGASASLPSVVPPNFTPLHQAIRLHPSALTNTFVRTLITAGADLSPPDTIHSLIRYSPMPTIRLALSKGASLHARDSLGGTTLHWAGSDMTKLKFLVESAPELIPIRDNIGQTVLFPAIYSEDEDYALEMFRTLMNTPQNTFSKPDLLNATNRHNETILHVAIRFYMKRLAAELIDAGIRVGVAALDGTELHFAIARYQTGTARRLVSAGVDVNPRAIGGHTPLMLSALNRSMPMVRFMVEEARADLGLRCLSGNKAVDIARISRFDEGEKYLTMMGG